jgi:hypothetical protein
MLCFILILYCIAVLSLATLPSGSEASLGTSVDIGSRELIVYSLL